MRHCIVGLGVLALALLLVPSATAQEGEGADTPEIRKVVLYKHGVAYFERRAEVSGDGALTLYFTEDQMKDVLKTLFAVDLDGGRIRSIDYDSKQPLSRRLQQIPLNLPPDRALTRFLGSLRGAPITFEYAGDEIKARIMGLEPYDRVTPEGKESRPRLVVLRDDGKIQAVDLFEARRLRLTDETLRRDLDKLLELSLRTHQNELKEVRVRVTGKEDDRRVRIGYLIEAPIWKTSYRLITGVGEDPLLQGWAIVENPSEEDWEDVDMTFVSGNPLSFVLDLYTSYYPARPVIDVAAVAARPSDKMAERALGERRARNGWAGGDGAEAGEALGRATETLAQADLQKSLEATTTGTQVGEMFAYEAKTPVTIPAGRAAMVPILIEPLKDAREVLFYRQAFSDTPAHAFWLTNSSELTLESGPITFFEGDTALGEGMLPRILKPGMKQIVPYALEPGATVEIKVDGREQQAYSARFVNGVMYLKYGYERLTSYRLVNETRDGRTLVLDHRLASGYQLREPADLGEEVDGHQRFELDLPGQSEDDLLVVEFQERTQSVALLRTGSEALELHLQKPYLSDKAKELLQAIIARRAEVAGLDRQIASLNEERREREQEQARIRENIKILRDNPAEREMRARYLKALEGADARIAAIQERVKELQAKKDRLERSLAKQVQEFKE